jgi:hypothetical protein
MATDDDTLMRDRVGRRPSILDQIDGLTRRPDSAAPPATPARVEDDDDALPADIDPWPNDASPYKAKGRNAPHPLPTLFFLPQGRLPKGFSYADLEQVFMREVDQPGMGPVLVARFSGSVVTEVVISGRHLLPLCNFIGMHVTPWVWQLPAGRDFRDPDRLCITGIGFFEVK